MDGRKSRDCEPPTLALRLKPYKMAVQQLRSVLRMLRDNTTVTFTPAPSMVLQTVRSHHVSKITFNSSCLYITDKSFKVKTINNVIPLLGNFMYMTSSRDLTKFNVQDTSDLSTKIHMSAPDFSMEFTSACVHGQDIVREHGDSSSRVDLDYNVICEVSKWIAPHTRAKRSSKKQSSGSGVVQVLIHANPPTIKFSMGGSGELEFTASSRVSFHEVKNIRVNLHARNLYQALINCAVTKLSCTLRVFTEHDHVIYLASKNSVFTVESFLTEEQFSRGDATYERNTSHKIGGFAGSPTGDVVCDGEDMENGCDQQPPPAPKKHDRSGGRKGDGEHGSRDKYETNKITNYMTSKGGASANQNDRGGSYFGDAKEESESDDSVTFEFVAPNAKKQKC